MAVQNKNQYYAIKFPNYIGEGPADVSEETTTHLRIQTLCAEESHTY